ncbi:MAG: tannase/feruloyl esterase family alpha/beta hydrolase [Solirubrobacteraceae bacterium]
MQTFRLRSLRAYLCLAGAAAVMTAVVVVLASNGGVASARTSRALVNASNRLASVSPTIPAKVGCSTLTSLSSLVTIPHFPTSIDSATDTAAAAGNPEYCDVKGMIAPQTHFEMKLPVSTWQGRYLQNGCGGYCGVITNQNFPSCDAQLGGDFAMATDDEGHTTSSGLGGAGLFAFNSQKLRNEYGYESEHALAIVAKTIIGDYYGQSPNYSYFDGCSDGGREAMAVAERYPTDFNGIIAGAPEIIAGPLNAELQTWDYRVNTDANGNAILTSGKLAALHSAVINACAGDDGVSDGIITDPRNCHFDVSSMQCPAGVDNASCLTPAQVTVADEIYQGPVDPRGRHLYPGGLAFGSEGSWGGFQVAPAPAGATVSSKTAAVYGGLSLPYLRYQYLPPGQLGPDPDQWSFSDRTFRSLFPVANTYDAMDTNLSAFRSHGGKLIIWQGWADQAIPVFGTIDYYDTLTSRMGGLNSTQQFARMFLFPTVAHCGGGYAASSFDLVYPMVQWVENGSAPSQITATDTVGANTLTRPVYPYPLVPKYNGTGSTSDASNFHPVLSPHARDYSQWIGNDLFYQPVDASQGSWRETRRSAHTHA